MSAIKVVHTADAYVVRELSREACQACSKGWSDGTLAHPRVSGVKCLHGSGRWQAGWVGPRGGWQGIGPQYTALRAAVALCEGLALAALIQRTD